MTGLQVFIAINVALYDVNVDGITKMLGTGGSIQIILSEHRGGLTTADPWSFGFLGILIQGGTCGTRPALFVSPPGPTVGHGGAWTFGGPL